MFNGKHRYKKLSNNDANEAIHPLDSNSLLTKAVSLLTHSWLLPLIKQCYKDEAIGEENQSDCMYSLPTKDQIDNLIPQWDDYVYNVQNQEEDGIDCWKIILYIEKYNIMRTWMFAAGEATLHTLIMWCWSYYWDFISATDATLISGFKLVFLIYALLWIKVICQNLSTFGALRVALRATSLLIYNCYVKSMNVPINTPSQQSLNLIGSSMQSIILCMYWFLHNLVYVLTLITLLFITIYIKIGYSSIIGILFMITFGLFCQLLISYYITKIDKKRLKIGDERVGFMNELFGSIRTLKANCWESPFIARISQLRKAELKQTKTRTILYGIAILCNIIIPTITMLIILLIYVYAFGNELDSSITVFLLSILSLLSISMRYLPICLSYTSELIVNIQRVNKFLSCAKTADAIEIQKDIHNTEYAINIENMTFQWNQTSSQFKLNNVSFQVKHGEMVAVVGSVGSGKTSLLQTVLNEIGVCDISDESTYFVYGNDSDIISYTSQSPMIFNATLRENILLNFEYDKDRYNKVLWASCLISDLKRLPSGDLTEIGEKGVNISGGQQMRIAYARALYRNSDDISERQLFLFDDPFSSVDVYIGKQMFVNGIQKYLHNKTRVVVINSQLHLLKYFQRICVLNEGNIIFNGTFQELQTLVVQQKNEYLYNLIPNDTFRTPLQNSSNNDENKDSDTDENDESKGVLTTKAKVISRIIPSGKVWRKYFENWSYNINDYDYSHQFLNCDIEDPQWLASKRINKSYLFIISFMFFLAFLSQSILPICDIWMLFWSENRFEQSTDWYLTGWVSLLFCIGLLSMIAVYLLAISSVNGSYHIFMTTFMYILRRPTLFFDVTPKGRLLNRFSSDTQAMDKELPYNIIRCISYTCSIFGYLIIVTYIFPYSIIVFVLAFPIFYVLYTAYFKSYLLSTRYRKIKLSPIMSLFNETLHGLDTIHAFRLEQYLQFKMKNRINNYCKWYFYQRSIAIWGAIWTDINVSTISVIIMGLSIYFKDSYLENNNANLLAISIWYLFVLGTNMQPQAWTFMRIQRDLTSVDRLFYFQNTVDSSVYEYKQINKAYNLKSKWPINGTIAVNNLKLRYRKDLDISLFIEQLNIKNGEKIGVCGRTGSGKSSILNAVFRLFECAENDKNENTELCIDDVDCFGLGLYELRNSLSIIMQTPVLFTGTVRFNLDPFEQYSDNEIWEMLRKVELFDFMQTKQNKLDFMVCSFGSNFSEGQKQLICFARVLLQKPKIIFMDEASSNIDTFTDSKILNMLLDNSANEDENMTIVCIAHRLQTIINENYDRIVVMENGEIAQIDTPNNLVHSNKGPFWRLVQDTNQQFMN